MTRTKFLVKYTELVMIVVMCFSLSVSLTLLSLPLAQATEKSEDLGVLAEPVEHHQEPVHADEQKENEEPGSDGNRDSGEFNNEHVFSYDADDDDWYYDPDGKDSADLTKTSSITTVGPRDAFSQVKSGDANASFSEPKMEVGDGKLGGSPGGGKEELPKKKVLQAPKGTIILYTAVIVVLIACIVFFSVWKKPFQAGRPVHQPTIGRGAEEGKRLLDHPFV